jgi:hypothetical protein
MAQRVILVDDIDGTEGGVDSVDFSYQGTNYRIDLSETNQKKLADALAIYIAHAQRVGSRGQLSTRTQVPALPIGPGSTGSGLNRDQLQAIRQWAQSEGIDVAPKGRIKADVIEAFDRAHG